MIWTTAAAAGLSAVLLANPHASTLLRIAGGIVPAGLGVSTLVSLRRPAAAPGATRSGRAYTTGLATNLGNPKAGMFAVSLLPQFVPADGPVFLSSVALGLLWDAVTGAWYLLFTWLVDRGRSLVTRPVVHRRLQVAIGCMLLCLGEAVATGV
ncbi:LysE family translocator [Actinoplanes sp. NPDC024001]|uniref:LysE family translocator n=1 Tax=Actinoplanes sp. NPDC024001 TaxID=3154598 RepID=UPI0033C8AF2C